MDSESDPGADAMSETKVVSKFHWRMVITAGTGFFTDAYDLFIIGVVSAILIPIWHLSAVQIAVLNGASLASAAFGAVFFGTLSDKFGRKKMYGFEVLILFLGAIFSAIALNFTWLLITRIVVGFGIGGDYPTSAVVSSEFSNKNNRGYLVLMVFAMQAVGLIVGPLIASGLLAFNLNQDLVWRILLLIGAIPAASVFYLRRKISETPSYLSAQAPLVVSRSVSELYGFNDETTLLARMKLKKKLMTKKWLKYMFATGGAWFLLDVAFYGNGVSSVLIMKAISPHTDILHHTILSTIIFLIFAVPGYAMAAKNVDKIGRKKLQILGFFIMGICYLLIGTSATLRDNLPLFILVFGISFFFVNFGPNTTTFLIPSELYPTKIRARSHGLSAAIGKVGAFAGAFLLPIVLKNHGISVIMIIMALVCLAGILITFIIPETANTVLE